MAIYSADFVPDTTGRNLGLVDARWDGWFRNINVSGTVTGNFSALAINKLTHTVVPFSATPVFAISQGTGFQMTLTGNVTSSSISALVPGVLVVFELNQDATGGRNFVWPPNVYGGAAIGMGPNERTTQIFYSDGVNLIAVSPGVIS